MMDNRGIKLKILSNRVCSNLLRAWRKRKLRHSIKKENKRIDKAKSSKEEVRL